MRNVLEHAAILENTRTLEAENLPPLPGIRRRADERSPEIRVGVGTPNLPDDTCYVEAMTAYERTLLQAALQRHRGDTARVAATLDIPVRTLQRRLKALGLQSRDYRP